MLPNAAKLRNLRLNGTQHYNDPRRPATPDQGFRFEPITSQEFAAKDYRPSWLVTSLLVAGQPAVVGGPQKALKTSLLLDLAVSLGTGQPFLGTFDVPGRVKVALLSAESGEWTLQETARRVCGAKGVRLEEADVLWLFRLPQLASKADVTELAKGLHDAGVGVVILDPLYMALLAGPEARGLEASNLFHVGPLLRSVSQACREAGATPIFCHHTTKHIEPGKPIELDDLAFAGIGEFARQWLLVNRREPFEPGGGVHRLWLSAGGSCGHSGLWGVDVGEGIMGDEFAGRSWDVEVSSAADVRAAEAEGKQERRERVKLDQICQDGAKVLDALDKTADTQGVSRLADVEAGSMLSHRRFQRAVVLLVQQGLLNECDAIKCTGKGMKTKRIVKGLRRTVSNVVQGSLSISA